MKYERLDSDAIIGERKKNKTISEERLRIGGIERKRKGRRRKEKQSEREESESSVQLDSSAVYGDAARMPPSSVLSTRYRTARRYPVICRGPTTVCHDIGLLLARCGASASAGAAVKWCQFNDESVRAEYYATTREGIRGWRCCKPEIFVFNDLPATLSKTDRLVFSCPRMCVVTCSVKNIVLCLKTSYKIGIRVTSARETVNSYCSKFSPDSSDSSYPKHRSFSISAAAERKQQVCV